MDGIVFTIAQGCPKCPSPELPRWSGLNAAELKRTPSLSDPEPAGHSWAAQSPSGFPPGSASCLFSNPQEEKSHQSPVDFSFAFCFLFHSQLRAKLPQGPLSHRSRNNPLTASCQGLHLQPLLPSDPPLACLSSPFRLLSLPG